MLPSVLHLHPLSCDPCCHMRQAWYAVAVLEHLDPAKPTPTQLLGMDLVLWRDSSGMWRAFQDCCPHRLAPLSEGRVDDKTGNLYCNYHGGLYVTWYKTWCQQAAWACLQDVHCGNCPRPSTVIADTIFLLVYPAGQIGLLPSCHLVQVATCCDFCTALTPVLPACMSAYCHSQAGSLMALAAALTSLSCHQSLH